MVWSTGGDYEKKEARQCYMRRASEASGLKLPDELELDQRPTILPDPSWIGVEVDFKLQTPWYSKDDRPFHVLDNPVRKDRVFGVPFMAAASWKGLLRWVCRVQAGLLEYLENHSGKMDGWQDEPWIVHLFGNEKGESEDFQQGALVFYPTWFSKIGFEVINPHSRARRAGTQPIYYEVVPADTEGVIRLLYAPLPGSADRDKVKAADAIKNLLDAIEALLLTYGISAKRTVGWGTAKIYNWKAFKKDRDPLERGSLREFKEAVKSWLASGENRS
jgi:CRISPR-associated protein Cmr2